MNDLALPPALCRSIFLAGTDTGVGKTWVAARLLRALREAGHRPIGMKPVAAGADLTPEGLRNEDALALAAADGFALPYALRNPCCLARPTSPHLAAEEAGIAVDMGQILHAYEQIASLSRVVIVEGAGGWLTPLSSPAKSGEIGTTMQDLAQALRLPVVLVVGLRLGCINHALLTAEAIRRSGLPLAGWIANPIDPHFTDLPDYVESLAQRLPEPLLWRLPPGS